MSYMDMIRKTYVSLVLLLAGGIALSAQGGYGISGTVTDSYGPVIGAAVMEQGTSNGTSTGPDGGFTLDVSGPSVLVEISCIGYVTQVYEAAAMPGNIELKEDAAHLCPGGNGSPYQKTHPVCSFYGR